MGSRPARFGVALILVMLAALPATAQESRRPNRALFGSASGGFDEELTVSGSAGAGYDTNATLNASEAGISVPAAAPTASSYSILSGGLDYSMTRGLFSLGVNGESARRFYYSASQSALSTHSAGVGVSFAPSRRTTFAVNQTVTYQPFNLYGLVPQPEPPGLGESNTPAVDFYLTNQGYASYSTSANFKRQLSRRATLSADYGFHFSDMPSVLGAYSSQTGSIRFTQSLTKGLGVHLGYGYTVASYSREDGDFGYHNIDAGVDYSNTLSFSRKTTLSFSTGTSFAPTNGNVGFHVTGSASLNHEIGRTWELTAGYNRYVGFFDFYAGLVEYQSATANLSGLLSRRLSFYTGLTATSGVLGADASGYGFGDLHSSTGLNVALNRYLSLNANYSLHRYSRADAVPVPDWIAADMLRQTVSVSISAQAPLFQRGRSRNASR